MVFALWPEPKVLIATDGSVPAKDFDSNNRGHTTAQASGEAWVRSLGLASMPFVVGEVSYEGTYKSAYVPVAAPLLSQSFSALPPASK